MEGIDGGLCPTMDGQCLCEVKRVFSTPSRTSLCMFWVGKQPRKKNNVIEAYSTCALPVRTKLLVSRSLMN